MFSSSNFDVLRKGFLSTLTPPLRQINHNTCYISLSRPRAKNTNDGRGILRNKLT